MGPLNPLSGGPGAFGGGGADLNETSAGAVADSESDTENWSPVSNASGRGSAGKTIVLLVLFWFDIALIILICLLIEIARCKSLDSLVAVDADKIKT